MQQLAVWSAVSNTAVSQRITFSGGCLGSSSDEARSEARYAWRCAEIRDLVLFRPDVVAAVEAVPLCGLLRRIIHMGEDG